LFVDNVKASDVYVQVYDIVAGNPTKRPVTVQLTKPTGGLMVGPWTVAGDAVTVLTGADGKAWFSNMWVIGQYRMDITGNPPRSFPFSLSATNGTYNVANLLGPNVFPELFYDVPQIDAMFRTNTLGVTNAINTIKTNGVTMLTPVTILNITNAAVPPTISGTTLNLDLANASGSGGTGISTNNGTGTNNLFVGASIISGGTLQATVINVGSATIGGQVTAGTLVASGAASAAAIAANGYLLTNLPYASITNPPDIVYRGYGTNMLGPLTNYSGFYGLFSGTAAPPFTITGPAPGSSLVIGIVNGLSNVFMTPSGSNGMVFRFGYQTNNWQETNGVTTFYDPVIFSGSVTGLPYLAYIDVTKSPFNADPTGTSDSTAAFQAVEDYTKLTNNAITRVYVPAGTYIASNIVIRANASNLNMMRQTNQSTLWFGDGYGKTFIRTYQTNGYQFSFNSHQNLFLVGATYQDIAFVGPGVTNATLTAGLPDFSNITTNYTTDGIYIADTNFVSLAIAQKVIFKGCRFMGFRRGMNLSDIVEIEIVHPEIEYCWQAGIYASNCASMNIEHAIMGGNGEFLPDRTTNAQLAAIYVRSGTGSKQTHCEIGGWQVADWYSGGGAHIVEENNYEIIKGRACHIAEDFVIMSYRNNNHQFTPVAGQCHYLGTNGGFRFSSVQDNDAFAVNDPYTFRIWDGSGWGSYAPPLLLASAMSASAANANNALYNGTNVLTVESVSPEQDNAWHGRQIFTGITNYLGNATSPGIAIQSGRGGVGSAVFGADDGKTTVTLNNNKSWEGSFYQYADSIATGPRVSGPKYSADASHNLFGIGTDGSQFGLTDIQLATSSGTSVAGGTVRLSIDRNGNVNVANLTGNQLVGTDGSDNLTSVFIGAGLTLNGSPLTLSATGGGGGGGTINAIQTNLTLAGWTAFVNPTNSNNGTNWTFFTGTNWMWQLVSTNGGGGYFTNTYMWSGGAVSNMFQALNTVGQSVFLYTTNGYFVFGTNRQAVLNTAGDFAITGQFLGSVPYSDLPALLGYSVIGNPNAGTASPQRIGTAVLLNALGSFPGGVAVQDASNWTNSAMSSAIAQLAGANITNILGTWIAVVTNSIQFTNGSTMTTIAAGSTNLWALYNALGQPVILVSTNGWVTIGTNSGYYFDPIGNETVIQTLTASNVVATGLGIGNFGGATNLNAGALTGGVAVIQFMSPASMRLADSATATTAATWTTNTPGLANTALQSAGSSFLGWQLITNGVTQYTNGWLLEMQVPDNYGGGSITGAVFVLSATNFNVKVTNVWSFAGAAVGSALGTAKVLTNNLPITTGLIDTNFIGTGFTLGGTVYPRSRIYIQIQAWCGSPYWTSTNNEWLVGAAFSFPTTNTQWSSLTYP
jgi:hypothetical protein